MTKLIDLTGLKFGRLTVIKRVENYISPKGITQTRWLCKCDCGNYKIVTSTKLKNKHTNSCGCLQKEIFSKIAKNNNTIHQKSNSRLYHIWQCMKQRCYDVNNSNYKNYGERNIKVCDEWLNNFINFYNWSINNGYNDTLTIDRIDVNKDYNITNCRWVNMKTQNNNKRNNRFITYNNETHTIAEWSKIMNINYSCLYNRLKRNWSIEKIFLNY